MTFEDVPNRLQVLDVVCRFALPGGAAVHLKWPIQLEDEEDDLAHAAGELAEAADVLASTGALVDDFEAFSLQAQTILQTAVAEGLPVRLLGVRIEPTYAGSHPRIVVDFEQLGEDLQWEKIHLDCQYESDFVDDLESMRDVLPVRKRMHDRMKSVGGDLLVDDVTVRQLERMGIAIDAAVAAYLSSEDSGWHPTLTTEHGSTIMIYARDGVIRCTATLAEGATWTKDSLRLAGRAAAAIEGNARPGEPVGKAFCDTALDPALTVERIDRGSNSVTLHLSTPGVWAVNRAGGMVEFAPAEI